VRPVAVFDTNILLSAQFWRGNPFRCLEFTRQGLVEGFTCQEILLELEEKLRTKFEFADGRIAEILADLLGFLRPIAISGNLKAVTADPDDDKVIECAVIAGASYVVTGDRRHLLSMGRYQGVQIVSVTEFLAVVAARR
jgi:uncharacterized protein